MAKQQIRNRNSKFRTQKTQNTKRIKNRKVKNGIKKRLVKTKVQDARQKIIQKKRKTVVDARDILARMAKTQDARSKINKIRNGRSPAPSTSGSVKAIGNNILRKTDRNGKISLVTNKIKQKSDMNLAIQKQLGLVSTSLRSPLKKVAPKRNTGVNTNNPVHIRKTILNDMDYNMPAMDSRTDQIRAYDPALYKWIKPDMRTTASQMINNLETTRQAMREALREELSNGWPNYATHKSFRPMRLQPTSYIDLDAVDDEEMPLASAGPSMRLHGTSRISNVHSRLDNSPITPESHGIFSQTKTKVMVPAGHRIVVSNLQPSVTQDDIKELFEDIGQLLAAKLVRPGVAEVIYKNLKDAQKAVDTYHNRQLDGQPMKCLLVNKRPLNQPTAMPITKSEGILATRKASAVPPCPPGNKLVPDITTIHKVLFQRK